MKNFMLTRKLLIGAYSTVLIIFVIIAAILLNILFANIESKNAFKLDLTQNKVYSLSKITTDTLKNLDKDIYIYYFVPQNNEGGKETMLLNELLNKYQAGNKKIHVKKVDPYVDIGLVEKFTRTDTEFPTNISVVVCQGNAEKDEETKFRPPISINSLIDSETNEVIAERIVTGAILSFNQSQTTNVWFLEGHSEFSAESNSDIRNYMEAIGYKIDSVSLPADRDKMLENDVLIIGGLTIDITDEEAGAVESFIDQGGNMILMFDSTKADYPKFNALLSKYKIKVQQNKMILEYSTDYLNPRFSKYKNMFTTDRSSHVITKDLKESSLITASSASPVNVEDVDLQTGEVSFDKYFGTVSQIITSSITSFLKDADTTTTTYESGDEMGPFNVGLAYELKQSNNINSKIAIYGTSFIYTAPTNLFPGNFGTFINTVNWVAEKDSLNIAGKSIERKLDLDLKSTTQVYIVSLIVIIIVPLLILGMGLFVWIRRKNR